MNISKLKKLMEDSGLSKQSIAENCSISRPTLDNLLNGSDSKISTIESLSAFFKQPIGYFFDESVKQTSGDNSVLVAGDNDGKLNVGATELENVKLENKHLKEMIAEKDKLIEEKERLINVLMKGK